jgi:hypothetical protein
VYTAGMKDGCGCLGKPQAKEKPLDEALTEAVGRGKRERQAVLKRVRRQRAIENRLFFVRLWRGQEKHSTNKEPNNNADNNKENTQ